MEKGEAMANRNFEFDFLDDFDINSIDVSTREGRWALTLREWMESGAKVCRFALHNAEEKGLCSTAIRGYIKSHNLDWTVYPERNKYNIYVVRA